MRMNGAQAMSSAMDEAVANVSSVRHLSVLPCQVYATFLSRRVKCTPPFCPAVSSVRHLAVLLFAPFK